MKCDENIGGLKVRNFLLIREVPLKISGLFAQSIVKQILKQIYQLTIGKFSRNNRTLNRIFISFDSVAAVQRR